MYDPIPGDIYSLGGCNASIQHKISRHTRRWHTQHFSLRIPFILAKSLGLLKPDEYLKETSPWVGDCVVFYSEPRIAWKFS